MAEYIEEPEIVKELEKLFDEFFDELGGLIQANVEPKDYPSDIEEALKRAKPGDTLFIFDDGNNKWLIPARSEESALEHVKLLVKKIGRST